MKAFYFLCSIPAAVAFWFGAQPGTGSFDDPQEPAAIAPAAPEVQEVIVVTQEEGEAPRAVLGTTMPRRAIRTELRSAGAGEPATFTFQAPVTAAVPAIPPVPGVAGLPGEHGVLHTVTAHQAGHALVISDKTHKAMDKLKNAKSDDDREEARDELREALSEQYDKYLERQEKELARMEEKLEELKSQLEKRRDAKKELVDLRLKTLENDANGLAWPGGEHGPDQMIWRSVAPLPPGAPAAPGWQGLATEGVQLFGHAGDLKRLRTRVADDGESKTIIIERRDDDAAADNANDDDDADEAAEADADDEKDSDGDADDDSRSRVRRRNK